MNMITAKEAYELANPMYDTYEAFIKDKIITAAENGKLEVAIRERPYCYWLYNEKELKDEDAKKIIKQLRNKGFEVDLFYQELQFVDIGLWVKWGRA